MNNYLDDLVRLKSKRVPDDQELLDGYNNPKGDDWQRLGERGVQNSGAYKQIVAPMLNDIETNDSIEESAVSPIDLIPIGGVPKFKNLFGKIGAGVPEAPALKKALTSGDIEQEMIKRLRADPTIPALDKKIAGKSRFNVVPDEQPLEFKNLKSTLENTKKEIPEVLDYPSGPWQKDVYSSYSEPLDIDFLKQHSGNALGKTDIEALKQSIQKEGLKEPLIMSFDPKTQRMVLGEGNHRLEALRQLGYKKAPTRMYRGWVEGSRGKPFKIKPSGDNIDKSYYPADASPSEIFEY